MLQQLLISQVISALSAPTVVFSDFTATDGGGSAFNTSTIAVNVTGSNTLLLAFWHSEFGTGNYEHEFTFNGVWGRPLFDTDGYTGGAGNRLLRGAYWVNPPAGSHNLVVQLAGGTPGTPIASANELTVAAILLNGAAQIFYPFRDTQKDISASTRTSETETVTSSVSDLVLHITASSLTAAGTPGAGETVVVTANDTTDDASLLVTKKAGSSSVTVGSTGWASTFPLQGLALSVKAAGSTEDHIVYNDSLTRSNESPLSNGSTWTQPAGSTVNPVSLVSNKATGSTANENIAIVATPTFGNDQRAQISFQGGQYTRVWVRVTGTGGYMLTTNTASMLQFYAVSNSGSSLGYTQLGSSITLDRNLVTGDLVELVVVGTTLNAYINGQFLDTRTDSTYTSGQPGLGSFGATDISAVFQATSLPARN